MLEAIRPTPSMDEEGLKCFKDALKESRCYLEYGSGGSTAYAVSVAQVPKIISVESDQLWCQRVKESVGSKNFQLYAEYCDLGEVGEWGTPRNRDHVQNFWKYIVAPWSTAKVNNLIPDTVLIDGRFRVASFLFSLVSARVGTKILFDDYLDRPHYFVAEEFCRLEEKHGRMGVFIAANRFSVPQICARIAQYSVIWD